MMVAWNFSLAARFLNKHADYAGTKEEGPSQIQAKLNDWGKFLPMAGLHSMIIQRVKEGWAEKEGEYERV
jgi:hypothetical protein